MTTNDDIIVEELEMFNIFFFQFSFRKKEEKEEEWVART